MLKWNLFFLELMFLFFSFRVVFFFSGGLVFASSSGRCFFGAKVCVFFFFFYGAPLFRFLPPQTSSFGPNYGLVGRWMAFLSGYIFFSPPGYPTPVFFLGFFFFSATMIIFAVYSLSSWFLFFLSQALIPFFSVVNQFQRDLFSSFG